MIMDASQLLKIGDVVQLSPECGPFAYTYMTVTSVKSWGVQGYVQNAGVQGVACYRAEYKDIERIGSAHWKLGEDNYH